MANNLKQIFGAFAGKELKNPDRLTCDVDNVLEDLKTEAQKHGLTLRACFPGQMHTMEYRSNRVNVDVEKDTNGKFVIKDFRIG